MPPTVLPPPVDTVLPCTLLPSPVLAETPPTVTLPLPPPVTFPEVFGIISGIGGSRCRSGLDAAGVRLQDVSCSDAGLRHAARRPVNAESR